MRALIWVVKIKICSSKNSKIVFLKNKIKEIAPVAISLIVCMLLLHLITGTSCLFRATIGIPCPGCGLTRAGVCVLKLDFKGAFYYHPLFWLVPIIIGLEIFKKIRPNPKKTLWINTFFKVCLIIAVVLYFVRMFLMFPHTEPMTFNENTVFLRAVKFIKSLLFKD